jgi:hypothetical protein
MISYRGDGDSRWIEREDEREHMRACGCDIHYLQPGNYRSNLAYIYQIANQQILRRVYSKVHVVTPRRPCWPRDAFDVLEGELTLEFGLERGQGTDQLGVIVPSV